MSKVMTRLEKIQERMRGGRTTTEILDDDLKRMYAQMKSGASAPHYESEIIYGMVTGPVPSIARDPQTA